MNRQRGFTLIELIVTMAIAVIVITVGVPSFQAMIRNNRSAAHTNEFMSALNLARSEAIKRGLRVALCPSNNVNNPTDCAGTDWHNGWMAFVDTANDAPNAAGDVILRVYEPLDGNDTLSGNASVDDYISFAPDGTSRFSGGNAFQAGTLTFSLCNAGDQQNTIVINSVGRARVAPQACP